MVHLVPLPWLPSARALAALFIKHIYRLHGMPDKIVSDRGPQFASRFWRELCHLLSIELNLSSAYHPETNGLVERANQTLVTYLRHFVSARQDDWASLLPWAEFALNNAVADSTGQTPFLLNYGQHPRVPVPMPVSSADSRVADWAVEAQDIWDRTQDAIRASKERMRPSADAHRRPAPTFVPGDLVWLSARNIRLRVESTKFAPRYLGPFKVLEQVNPVVYRLALPPHLGITDTFHVSLLKPVYMSRFSESSTGTSGVRLRTITRQSLAYGLLTTVVGKTLYAVFNILENDLSGCKYIEGNLTMKVSRKGTAISALEADWLEMTTYYYKQGFSLIDSFVHWEMLRGEQTPKSLDGLFVYEDEAPRVTALKTRGNDAIIVEQWTVFERMQGTVPPCWYVAYETVSGKAEVTLQHRHMSNSRLTGADSAEESRAQEDRQLKGSDIKTDYGPLLHTLAEFGWLLTCVIPTPIIRHNSEGNLTTKQIIFLQRPVISHPSQPSIPSSEKKIQRHLLNEEKMTTSSRSIGHQPPGIGVDKGHTLDELYLSSPKQPWNKESHQEFGSFPGFNSSDSMLRDLDDSQFDQEEGVTQVTCM
ncbi:unnamed protein product [Ranitomeya imitator]|uniref:Integrase catalytic domain-containing protein n=1 Tax=Ranitomeya imitator TaxID=111125 RepID=A0ABN9M1L0_9NEOB|nr:unnamed protein product [Ranitomeya imitator]